MEDNKLVIFPIKGITKTQVTIVCTCGDNNGCAHGYKHVLLDPTKLNQETSIGPPCEFKRRTVFVDFTYFFFFLQVQSKFQD